MTYTIRFFQGDEHWYIKGTPDSLGKTHDASKAGRYNGGAATDIAWVLKNAGYVPIVEEIEEVEYA